MQRINLLVFIFLLVAITIYGHNFKRVNIEEESVVRQTLTKLISEPQVIESDRELSVIWIKVSQARDTTNIMASLIPIENIRNKDNVIGYSDISGYKVFVESNDSLMIDGVFVDSLKPDPITIIESKFPILSDPPVWYLTFKGKELIDSFGYRLSSETIANSDRLYNLTDLDIQPSFPGGSIALYEWINTHLKYPEIAKQKGIQGKVQILCCIRHDGNIVPLELLLEDRFPDLNEEALRLVTTMPKWIPGSIRGKCVSAKYIVSIQFKLNN